MFTVPTKPPAHLDACNNLIRIHATMHTATAKVGLVAVSLIPNCGGARLVKGV